jgi:hypothetical protein
MSTIETTTVPGTDVRRGDLLIDNNGTPHCVDLLDTVRGVLAGTYGPLGPGARIAYSTRTGRPALLPDGLRVLTADDKVTVALPRPPAEEIICTRWHAAHVDVEPDESMLTYPLTADHRPDLVDYDHSVTVERVAALTAREWWPRQRKEYAGRLAVVERHNGKLTKICCVGGHDGIGNNQQAMDQAARGTARTYRATYVPWDDIEAAELAYPLSDEYRTDLRAHGHTITVERLAENIAHRLGQAAHVGELVIVERFEGRLGKVIYGGDSDPEDTAESLARIYGATYVSWDGAQ